MEKYSTKELCEQVLKIKYDTFTAHKQRYLNKLRLAYEVYETLEDSKLYYHLKPLNNLYTILNCDIGKRDINIIASILKVIMQGDIIPVRAEIAKATNVPEGTVKSYIKFLKKHEIIIGPEIEEFIVTNRETGEIIKDYKKKKAAYVYYDIKADGSREKLSHQQLIHNKHSTLWREKYDNQDYLHLVIRKLNYQPLVSVLRRDVWDELNNTFGLNKGARTEMVIIHPEIVDALKEYFTEKQE